MKLITKEQHDKMLEQGKANAERAGGIDFMPVVKLFTPDANATWLLTELDPENPDLAFGLCDLGYPELGWVSLSEIAGVKGPLGLPIERDRHFAPTHSIAVYAEAARHAGTIVENVRSLEQAKAALDAQRQNGGAA